jgi:adenine-specific DNA-methyltransferase
VLTELLDSSQFARHFWEPPGAAGTLLAGLLPAVAHAPPAFPLPEQKIRALLLALYEPETSAALHALRPDELGELFEQILGGDRAAGRSERRAAGIYYTPAHIVDYVLENTVTRALAEPGRRPLPLVLDPACGAGAFLLPAYRMLAGARPHAALRSLYGVDRDPYAVAAARLALLLAVRECQLDAPADPSELLASISRRVVWGNALFAPGDVAGSADGLDWHSTFPDVFDAGGFDVVVGNPPYLNLKRGALGRAEKARLAQHYRSARGQYDAFGLFVERTLGLLAPGGRQALVVPRPLLAAESYAPVRRLMLDQQIEVVADAGAPFATAAVEAAVVVVCRQRSGSAAVRLERLQPGGALLLGCTSQALFEELPSQALSFRLTERAATLIRRLTSSKHRLADVAAQLTRGLELGKRSPAISSTERPGAQPLLRGEDVARYTLQPARFWYTPGADERTSDSPPERLLIRRVANRIEAVLDRSGAWTLNTLYTLVPRAGVSGALLLGLLNARLFSFYLRVVYLSDDRLFPYLRRSQLVALPLPLLPPNNPADAARCDEIATLATELQALHTRSHAPASDATRATLEAQISVHERRIDLLVYHLFGLSDDDIALVEGDYGD